jgi:Skp family chaperone for outer membrane proteins
MKLALVLALLMVPAAAAWNGTRPPLETTSRVAVVDLIRLIQEHNEALADQQKIEAWLQQMQDLYDSQEKELETLRDELEQFRPGSDEFRQAREDLQVQGFRLEIRRKELPQELDEMISQALTRAYQRAIAACEQYREQSDIDVVHQLHSAPLTGRNKDELLGGIVLRATVAHRPQLDITDAVLTILNQ